MSWDEKAEDYAQAHHVYGHRDVATNYHGFRMVVAGARWQREALLADDAVERAARALYAEDVNESMDTPWPDYDSPKNVGRPLYEERARNALLAAIGDNDE